jgi:hypothetical protein
MKFTLGHVVATPGALALAEQDPRGAYAAIESLLDRHRAGDWGTVCADDAQANDNALLDESRLFSAYVLAGEKVWIITEAVGDDGRRASTCVLLPEEY